MKKSFLTIGFVAAFLMIAANAFAAKTPWAEVKAPEITSIKISDENPNDVVVNFNALTNDQGGDLGVVEMKGPASGTADFGKTRREAKTVTFKMSSSGTYTFTVKLQRRGEKETKDSAPKTFTFSLPLAESTLSLLGKKGGIVNAKWTAVPEAEKYVLHYQDANGKDTTIETKELKAEITGLKIGQSSKIYVEAVRGKEKKSSLAINKIIKDENEREWFFTVWGISTSPEVNTMKILDANDLKVSLTSCSYDPKTDAIVKKGGKFTDLFDGISFYYTVIDPKKENFELTATATIDYVNPIYDAQEGFGLIAFDSIPDLEEQARKGIPPEKLQWYTNSAGNISGKYTKRINGLKVGQTRCAPGARFVTNITKEAIAKGDTFVSEHAIVESAAFSYDNSYNIKKGDVYRITLKKDNTGYHMIYKKDLAGDDFRDEYILYHPENLQVLDPDHVYIGFVVARGCNATFSDVSLKITDPKNDPPAELEPPMLVPLKVAVDSPTTYYTNKYPFVFTSNTKGTIKVEDASTGKVLIANDKVEAKPGKQATSASSKNGSTDFEYRKTININKNGITDLLVTFTPEEGWEPPATQVDVLFPKRRAVGQYNRETMMDELNYSPVSVPHTVIQRTFKGEKNTLYVSPEGDPFGDGTSAKPLDLITALGAAAPGQTIIMKKGTYYPKKSIEIEKGIDGTEKKRITLRGESATEHSLIDFSGINAAPSAFNLKGNYWTMEYIDITKTPDNTKALQVWGSYNTIRCCDTYLNGDTGIQVAGQSMDPFEKWPHDNTIIYCESFGNCDPAMNNADGFAAKLTAGNNNKFIGCIAHHNVDDGWDLYAKIETGPIGAVLLENCITYANGTRLDGSGQGDGNGFKLGGEGINVPHVLKNSISWGNTENGVTCNSNPGLILENVTSYGNANRNITLYGKGTMQANPRTFKTTNILSLKGGAGDDYKETPELLKEDTYFFNGAQAMNSKKEALNESVFYSVDTSIYANGYKADGKTFNRIPRNADGSFNLGELFLIKDANVKVGAQGLGTKPISAVNAK